MWVERVKDLEKKLNEREEVIMSHIQAQGNANAKILELIQALEHAQEKLKLRESQISQIKEENDSHVLKIGKINKILFFCVYI